MVGGSKERLLSRKGRSVYFEDDHINRGEKVEVDRITKLWEDVVVFAGKVYEMGRSEPNQVIFGVKSGLALAFVSVLTFFKEPFSFISEYSIWAIITIIEVFELSVGATLCKEFNHALGTCSAALLAFGIGELSLLAGECQEVVVIIGIFITGFISSYVRLYPSMRPYEFGFRFFMLTFSIVLVSGTSDFFRTAAIRLLLVAVGAGVSLVVNICIHPLWSGEDLHKLVVKNFRGVASSLEACVTSYLQNVEYERIPSKILVYAATDDPLYSGYRAAVESSSEEETLLGFAIWEPPHGRYKMFRYPWDKFVKVGGALRHCTFMVMSMHGCILSEIQAAPELRLMFRNEIQRVGIEGAKVLRELGSKLEKLEKLSPDFDLLEKVHVAAEELQMLIDEKSYHLVKLEKWSTARRPKGFEDPDHLEELKEDETNCHAAAAAATRIDSLCESQHMKKNFDRSQITNMSINPSCFGNFEELQWPSRLSILGDAILNEREVRTYDSARALSLANFTSSLIEFVARLQNLLDEYQELSDKAKFSLPNRLN